MDAAISAVAAAIGEPARTRMLCSLLDGHARTGTELAILADVSPSTASVHLSRLKAERLVRVAAQGRHRYYALAGPEVARALERLSVLAGVSRARFVPSTPEPLRAARSCYDHMAGALAVALHDRFLALGWITPAPATRTAPARTSPARTSAARASSARPGASYQITPAGETALRALSIDLEPIRAQRRRFAYGCLDWSERRPHLGGALGAALLTHALARRWVARELDSRALRLTAHGRHELHARFGLSS
ncbi:MAG TPA: helix-turn-helix transcriptional regulator [Acidobacteriaceae bacterium]|nr:helix-turn-helix transcriptional regulator [Acidobacteriaceae bacterium]